ncbi:MAG: hypothetical protein C4334_10175 [Pyrinomonas sp.]
MPKSPGRVEFCRASESAWRDASRPASITRRFESFRWRLILKSSEPIPRRSLKVSLETTEQRIAIALGAANGA